MIECTWKDCGCRGTIPQTDNDGKEWANLCEKHHQMIEDVIIEHPFQPKKLLSYWVKAQGGALIAANKTLGRRK